MHEGGGVEAGDTYGFEKLRGVVKALDCGNSGRQVDIHCLNSVYRFHAAFYGCLAVRTIHTCHLIFADYLFHILFIYC